MPRKITKCLSELPNAVLNHFATHIHSINKINKVNAHPNFQETFSGFDGLTSEMYSDYCYNFFKLYIPKHEINPKQEERECSI